MGRLGGITQVGDEIAVKVADSGGELPARNSGVLLLVEQSQAVGLALLGNFLSWRP